MIKAIQMKIVKEYQPASNSRSLMKCSLRTSKSLRIVVLQIVLWQQSY